MIIWLASYPRSGNTYFRILLHHFYGMTTYSIYEDGVYKKISDRYDFQPLPMSLIEMQKSDEIFFVKTHELPQDNCSAIYLVRDGRDSLVSYARYIQHFHPSESHQDFQKLLRQLIVSNEYFGGWGNHVLSWIHRQASTVVIKFEDLVSGANSQQILQDALEQLNRKPLDSTDIPPPNFEQLKESSAQFFRKGKIDNWIEEMPLELQDTFWQRYGQAMLEMDYFFKSQLIVDKFKKPLKSLLNDQQVKLSKKETTIQLQQQQLVNQETTIESQQQELSNQKAAIESRQQELANQKAAIESQQQELSEKEQVIQSLLKWKNISVAYWYFYRIRPFVLEKVISTRQLSKRRYSRLLKSISLQKPKQFVNFLFQVYREPQNNLKLIQYSPIPLTIPERYYKSTLKEKDSLPRVSIVTPSYNQAPFIERTLKSVLDQNYPNLEYIVQDGASTDGTVEILNKYYSQIFQVESIKDSGQANAINRGFSKSQGTIMAWLNSDDLFLPGSLDYIVNYFRNHPQIDVVYGHRILIDDNDHEVGRWILPNHDYQGLLWADYIPQETLFWRRSIWEKVGGYIDETYRFAMDWELLLRFQEAGAKMVRLPRFLGAFRLHSQQKTSASLETLGEQEMNRLREKYHGRPIPQIEVELRIRPYWWRSGMLRLLYQLGIVRY